MGNFAVHFNSNLACAISIKTSGPIPMKYEVCEITVLPLDSFYRPNKNFQLLNLSIQPIGSEHSGTHMSEAKFLKYKSNGYPSDKSAWLFEHWYAKLNLGKEKRIIPFCYDWPLTKMFLGDWLGFSYLDLYFSPEYRDPTCIAAFQNDMADWNSRQIPYPKTKFSYLLSQSKIEHDKLDDTLTRARQISELYQVLLKKSFI